MKKLKSILVLLFCTFFFANAQQTNTVSVNTSNRAQTISGFGAAIAYYETWLTAHPKKADLYDLIFKDLNLGILRLRNVYANNTSAITNWQEVVEQANISLGHPVDILLSTWSPPANLKANGVLNGGTLLKTNGQFVYNDWAQWWYDAILAYSQIGIVPTYISLQNEPDYENTGWETCIFKSTETTDYPGYGIALQALYNKIQGLTTKPKILGPEVTGIGFNNFQNYMGGLNKTYLDGYAYHLYNGGDANNPDSYNTNLTPIKANYGDKPNIMTEFSGGTWFNTAWLIQNCLLNANASGYLYWDLIWGRPNGQGGMISLENPWESSSWTTTNGYVINGDYYALKHFSKFISKGYTRVEASVANTNIRSSAFLSSDGKKLAVVLLNVASSAETAAMSFNGFNATSVTGYQSVDNNYFYSLASITPGANVSLPARSATTLEFTSGPITNVTGVTVAPTATSVKAGENTLLTATVLPSDATNKAVTWSSNTPSVATVNANGLVTGISAGNATITVTTVDGAKTATCNITVTGSAPPCNFGTPLAAGLPAISSSYSKVYIIGTGGPNLGNVTNFTINWNLSLNGLWQLSFNTSNGIPQWWLDLRTKATWNLNQSQPDITFTNTGITGFDGIYWVAMDGSNFVLVSKSGGFAIYFSNSGTAPTCTKSAELISDATQKYDIKFHPNPFSNFLTLEIPNPENIINITITDLSGKIIKALLKDQIMDKMAIGRDLKNGIYLLKIQDSNGIKIIKVIKK